MALLRLCTLFILLELQHCHRTDHAGKAPKHRYYGYHGLPGTPGHNGHNGLPGKDGREGQKGEKGDRGIIGAQGPPGKFGPTGPVGPAGPKGLMGPAGAAGPVGPAGPKGLMGPAGAPGPIGPAGPKGLMGPVGPNGPKGERGPAGPLPPINLVELQSELHTLKAFVNKIAAVTQFQFTRWVGRKYFVTDKKKGSFDEAVKLCSSVGGVPALPTSLEENQALQGLLSGSGEAWLSANDRTTEGRFVDLQEKAIQFSKWGSGQPNGGRGENCVIMDRSGHWYDKPCGYPSAVIVCEI